ncbi:hypothetical protein RLA81_01025, partial [Streptococcus pneumoniae]|nr:hypothetical protein [Streptococcus pneumoniae]
HQKRKDEICPFSSLAFLQPTTVDKEPTKTGLPSQMRLSPSQMHFLDKKIGRTRVLPTKNMLLKGN